MTLRRRLYRKLSDNLINKVVNYFKKSKEKLLKALEWLKWLKWQDASISLLHKLLQLITDSQPKHSTSTKFRNESLKHGKNRRMLSFNKTIKLNLQRCDKIIKQS